MATSKQHRGGKGRSERRIRVRGVRRDEPDLKKLAHALVELSAAQAEAEAQAEHQAGEKPSTGDAA